MSPKDPPTEEVAHVSLRQALDSFERDVLLRNPDVIRETNKNFASYAVFIFLSVEINKICNHLISLIAKSRGGKL